MLTSLESYTRRTHHLDTSPLVKLDIEEQDDLKEGDVTITMSDNMKK